MKTFVVDASVAAKWWLPRVQEELVTQAENLAQSHLRGFLLLAVPDLFWGELANVFWKAARTGKILPAEAIAGLNKMMGLSLASHPTSDLASNALEIALRYDRTVYDSLYVALALKLGTDLITADQRLANALAAHLPVKWLGSI